MFFPILMIFYGGLDRPLPDLPDPPRQTPRPPETLRPPHPRPYTPPHCFGENLAFGGNFE